MRKINFYFLDFPLINICFRHCNIQWLHHLLEKNNLSLELLIGSLWRVYIFVIKNSTHAMLAPSTTQGRIFFRSLLSNPPNVDSRRNGKNSFHTHHGLHLISKVFHVGGRDGAEIFCKQFYKHFQFFIQYCCSVTRWFEILLNT